MQYQFNINQLKEDILSLIATNQNGVSFLQELTKIIGNFFKVDACFAIIAPQNLPQEIITGTWNLEQNQEQFLSSEKTVLTQFYFENLKTASQDKFSYQKNTFPEIFSHGFASLAASFFGKNNSLAKQSKTSPAKGVLVLLKSQSYEWNNSEPQNLELLAEIMAIAFSHIELEQKIQTQARYQSLLSNFSAAVAKSSDIQLLFELALSEIGTALPLEQAAIITIRYKDPFFIQRKRKQAIKATLTVAEHWSAPESKISLPNNFSFQLSNSESLQTALDRAPHPLIIDRGTKFPDLAAEFLPADFSNQADSTLLIMPLMGKSSHSSNEEQGAIILGFVVLQRAEAEIWHQQEIELINWIGVQLSTALIHHQTLTQVQSIVEERTAQLQWSLDVQGKLSEKMRQQISQLKRLNELKDDFLSSMSHELKTPMTSMKMAIKMLRQNIPETMRERYLNILEEEWHREFNLIKDLLTLRQVESGELSFEPQELNLNRILDNLATSFTQKWQPDKGLKLETKLSEPELLIHSDLDSFQHILNELLLNAAKYSDADTTVGLSATARNTLQGKEVEITVNNYGAEIEENELPYIFDKFRRGKGVTDRAVPGTGLGLTLVKYLVEHLSGNIKVTNQAVSDSDLYETTFTVTLPQHQ